MKNETKAALLDATTLTFEALGFMFPARVLEEEQKAAPFEAAVCVEFGGSSDGVLVLSLSGGILPTIIENMVGDTAALGRRAGHDALGELANVICGNVLTLIHDKGETFLLEPPRLLTAADLERPQGRLLASATVGMEKGRADVHLYAKEGPAVR
jgi:CheY-specific phosphatase CheX